ncbi:MAG: hypothetical protein IJP08_05430, partial [Bacteroidaceae bacterium]|nr:hypothetical protein [Bacteroidaceae bacterium]
HPSAEHQLLTERLKFCPFFNQKELCVHIRDSHAVSFVYLCRAIVYLCIQEHQENDYYPISTELSRATYPKIPKNRS